MSNVERQREFRARHPGYRNRFRDVAPKRGFVPPPVKPSPAKPSPTVPEFVGPAAAGDDVGAGI